MSNELTLNSGIFYKDASMVAAQYWQMVNRMTSVSLTKYQRAEMTVGIVQTLIPLGSVSTLGWMGFLNLDPINFITLYCSQAGNRFAILPGGGACMLYAGPDLTAPYALANTAACQMDYIIVNQ